MQKAHRHRRLLHHDISILSHGAIDSDRRRIDYNALVDPPTRTIQMDRRTAQFRGLAALAAPAGIRTRASDGQLRMRRALVKEENRQVARLSISHDGGYAVAVCMAFNDERDEGPAVEEPIVDDGEGDALHQPIWGDEGFIAPVAGHGR